MSLKLKFFINNIVMLLSSILLCLLAVFLIGNIFSYEIKVSYNLSYLEKKNFYSNPFSQLKEIYLRTFKEVQDTIRDNPELLLNKSYDAKLNKSFMEHNCYLAVRKGEKYIYEGKKGLAVEIEKSKEDIPDNLKKPGKIPPQKVSQNNLIIRQMDFTFIDGNQGSFYIIVDTTEYNKILSAFSATSICAVILIICIATGILAYKVSKSIIAPIEKLKEATNKIKKGDLNFTLVPYSGDEMGELCSAFDDMRKQLKESLELQNQYENNRKELLSNISHDLKTPITAIKGYIEGIKDGVADSPAKMDKYINTIYTKSISMDKLIDELFLYSKLDLNKLPFNFEDVDINAYLQDSVEDMQFELEKLNIELKYKTSLKESLHVTVDREKLSRVVTNIINNSAKYMDKNEGVIEVILEKESNYAKITINDNGRGISEDSLPFIFDRFYREDSSRNQLTGGTGLGLAICKKIIEEHGGTIFAESIKDVGTAIVFTLKLNN